ncbi:TPA: ATP-binding protein [Vibrio vulnificus]|uniref:ATP-binding protein n=1 Tax=Vibrio vulnificus TaxID=672 RepID=A0A8H9MYP5_VIBVL|nr:ATP-binding protein [Vibrio vulnificus]HAS8538349.1 ATP-binding protein [Vibrio vulnificus]
MINYFAISNYKGFLNPSDLNFLFSNRTPYVSLQNVLQVMKSNIGVGSTSLYEAFHGLITGLRDSNISETLGYTPNKLAPTKPMELAITFTLGNFRIAYEVDLDKYGICEEQITFGECDQKSNTNFPIKNPSKIRRRRTAKGYDFVTENAPVSYMSAVSIIEGSQSSSTNLLHLAAAAKIPECLELLSYLNDLTILKWDHTCTGSDKTIKEIKNLIPLVDRSNWDSLKCMVASIMDANVADIVVHRNGNVCTGITFKVLVNGNVFEMDLTEQSNGTLEGIALAIQIIIASHRPSLLLWEYFDGGLNCVLAKHLTGLLCGSIHPKGNALLTPKHIPNLRLLGRDSTVILERGKNENVFKMGYRFSLRNDKDMTCHFNERYMR